MRWCGPLPFHSLHLRSPPLKPSHAVPSSPPHRCTFNASFPHAALHALPQVFVPYETIGTIEDEVVVHRRNEMVRKRRWFQCTPYLRRGNWAHPPPSASPLCSHLLSPSYGRKVVKRVEVVKSAPRVEKSETVAYRWWGGTENTRFAFDAHHLLLAFHSSSKSEAVRRREPFGGKAIEALFSDWGVLSASRGVGRSEPSHALPPTHCFTL